MDKKAQYNMMEESVTDLKADVGKWKSLANRKGSSGGGGDYDPSMINQVSDHVHSHVHIIDAIEVQLIISFINFVLNSWKGP